MLISLNIHCARILSAHREIERQKDKQGEEREGLGEIGRKGRGEERERGGKGGEGIDPGERLALLLTGMLRLCSPLVSKGREWESWKDMG